MSVWLVDGNNVMGSRPDRWWNDRPAAQARLTQQIAEWCRQHRDDVVLVFDGRPVEAVAMLAGGNLRIEFASRQGPRSEFHRRGVQCALLGRRTATRGST